MTDEEFTRANWEHVGEGVITICLGDCESGTYCATLPGWAAAAEFTRERLEQIRLIEEERAMLCGKLLLEDRDVAIVKRILVRLDAALAGLKRGMKPEVVA